MNNWELEIRLDHFGSRDSNIDPHSEATVTIMVYDGGTCSEVDENSLMCKKCDSDHNIILDRNIISKISSNWSRIKFYQDNTVYTTHSTWPNEWIPI